MDPRNLNQNEEDGGRGIRKRWTAEEDVNLISAWLNTSKDPVVSNEHRLKSFWKRVTVYYKANDGSSGSNERGPSQCKARWNKINHGVNKFVGCYAQASSRRKSGESEDDVLSMAYELYKNDMEKEVDSIVEEIQYNYTHPDVPPAPIIRRVHIDRGREEGHTRLWNDYLSDNPTYTNAMFRRRFRMNKPLFIRIVTTIENGVPYLRQRRDATGRLGLSALQKCTSAIRMMAYGCSTDAMDEYLRLAETTAHKCLLHFVEGVINLFDDEYLRRPTAEDLQRLLNIGEHRGFPRNGREHRLYALGVEELSHCMVRTIFTWIG
ncbi:PREDICTED: uncharacterized protein LOC104738085 [Camelina sativa]|uniref:Uncharacterized protein LOC104738085 n=1 Tax=Camelina sativa TaxID=90675 RepID=A0ABM0VIC2_CAMSA|nr:PREDICTED: uncharacterized protein LOC104738085 [Camelina sativa]